MNTKETQEQIDNLERSRDIILSLGYDYIRTKSRVKKSIITLKKILQNNAYHYKTTKTHHFEYLPKRSIGNRILIPQVDSRYHQINQISPANTQ